MTLEILRLFTISSRLRNNIYDFLSCFLNAKIIIFLFLAKCPIGKSKNNLHLRDSSVVRAVERSSEMAEPNILFKIKIFNAGS